MMRINSFSLHSYAFMGSRPPKKSQEQISEEKQQKILKAKAVLEEAKANNIIISLDELSQRTNITKSALAHYVKSSALNGLWFWVRTKDGDRFSKEEMAIQTEQIKESLQLAAEQKKAITIPEITELTGIEGGVIDNRIAADETLRALRNRTLAFEDKNYRLEVSAIKKVLQEAKQAGLKITQAYIADKTGIHVSTVQKRIAQNGDLDRLFSKLRVKEHTNYTKDEIETQNAEILAILNAAAEKGEKLSISDIAKKMPGIKQGTIGSRLNLFPELNAVWLTVKSTDAHNPTEDTKDAQKAKIEKVLTETREKGETITLAKIASLTGITRRVVHSRIQSSKTLSALWQETQPVSNREYTEEELEVQNVLLERILLQRIQDKMKPSYSQIGDYLEIAKDTVKQRIESDPGLLGLFNRGKDAMN